MPTGTVPSRQRSLPCLCAKPLRSCTMQVTHAVVVIVLDLSDPPSLLPNALHWLGLVRQKLAATYGLFERRGLAQLPGQLKTRQRSKTFAQQHADAQLVDCPGEQ